MPKPTFLPYAAKPRCLFLNVSDVSQKLLSGKKLTNKYKPLFYVVERDGTDLVQYVRRLGIKSIVVDTTTVHFLSDDIINQIIFLSFQGVKVYEAKDFYELINERVPLIKLQSNTYLIDDIFAVRLNTGNEILKRFFDFGAAALMILPASILIAAGAILTVLSSRGPAFFKQIRVGKEGKEFTIYKLRTMVSNHHAGFTTTNDSRITPIGKILRKTKIDELPQLFNILRGDMSLIGPRPERPEFVAQAIMENVFFNLRHTIRPGVTGWAQVNLPKATPEDNLKKLEFDLYYIKKYNLLFDFRIIWDTIKVVLTMNSH